MERSFARYLCMQKARSKAFRQRWGIAFVPVTVFSNTATSGFRLLISEKKEWIEGIWIDKLQKAGEQKAGTTMRQMQKV